MKAGVIGATLAFLLMIGFPVVSFAGPAVDTDGDGSFDWLDNCKAVSNAAQVDSDGDGCGNRCDADFDQNGTVGVADFTLWSNALGDTAPGPPFNASVDADVDGTIGIGDFTIWSNSLGGPPGPSGIADPCL
jgi:hypothetical protein